METTTNETKTCRVEGCDRPVAYWFKSVCYGHEMRIRRTGSIGTTPLRPYRKRNDDAR